MFKKSKSEGKTGTLVLKDGTVFTDITRVFDRDNYIRVHCNKDDMLYVYWIDKERISYLKGLD